MFVFGNHANGVSIEGGGFHHSDTELGDLEPGAKFWLMVKTDGAPGPLTHTLDLMGNDGTLSKLVVQAPEVGKSLTKIEKSLTHIARTIGSWKADEPATKPRDPVDLLNAVLGRSSASADAAPTKPPA